MFFIIITDDLCIKAFVHSVLLSKDFYMHLMNDTFTTGLTEVSNLLAFCKNLCSDLQGNNDANTLNFAISALKQYAKNNTENFVEDTSCTSIMLISFLTELQLFQLQNAAHRYSA